MVGGTTYGSIKPWAAASRNERTDYCVACQAIQLVTAESEPADIAAMVRRGLLFDKDLRKAPISEYTDSTLMVAEKHEAFEKTAYYSDWPLKVLKLAYPDDREELTPTSAGVMLHHLLLLQYMNTCASDESRAAVVKAQADIYTQQAVTDDKRSPADKARQFRTALGKLAFGIV